MCSSCNKCLLNKYFAAHKCTANTKNKCRINKLPSNIKSTEFTQRILPHFRGVYSLEIAKDDTIVTLGLEYYTTSTETDKYEEHRKRTMNYMR